MYRCLQTCVLSYAVIVGLLSLNVRQHDVGLQGVNRTTLTRVLVVKVLGKVRVKGLGRGPFRRTTSLAWCRNVAASASFMIDLTCANPVMTAPTIVAM